MIARAQKAGSDVETFSLRTQDARKYEFYNQGKRNDL